MFASNMSVNNLFLLISEKETLTKDGIKDLFKGQSKVQDIWQDSFQPRRSVALIKSETQLDVSRQPPSASVKVYRAEPAISLLVEVSDIRGLKFATVDKLRMLFMMKRWGGSSVQSVRRWALPNVAACKGLFYEITFEDGWDAVHRACYHSWKVGSDIIRPTPLFPSFVEDVDQQLNRLASEASNRERDTQKSDVKGSQPSIQDGVRRVEDNVFKDELNAPRKKQSIVSESNKVTEKSEPIISTRSNKPRPNYNDDEDDIFNKKSNAPKKEPELNKVTEKSEPINSTRSNKSRPILNVTTGVEGYRYEELVCHEKMQNSSESLRPSVKCSPQVVPPSHNVATQSSTDLEPGFDESGLGKACLESDNLQGKVNSPYRKNPTFEKPEEDWAMKKAKAGRDKLSQDQDYTFEDNHSKTRLNQKDQRETLPHLDNCGETRMSPNETKCLAQCPCESQLLGWLLEESTKSGAIAIDYDTFSNTLIVTSEGSDSEDDDSWQVALEAETQACKRYSLAKVTDVQKQKIVSKLKGYAVHLDKHTRTLHLVFEGDSAQVTPLQIIKSIWQDFDEENPRRNQIKWTSHDWPKAWTPQQIQFCLRFLRDEISKMESENESMYLRLTENKVMMLAKEVPDRVIRALSKLNKKVECQETCFGFPALQDFLNSDPEMLSTLSEQFKCSVSILSQDSRKEASYRDVKSTEANCIEAEITHYSCIILETLEFTNMRIHLVEEQDVGIKADMTVDVSTSDDVSDATITEKGKGKLSLLLPEWYVSRSLDAHSVFNQQRETLKEKLGLILHKAVSTDCKTFVLNTEGLRKPGCRSFPVDELAEAFAQVFTDWRILEDMENLLNIYIVCDPVKSSVYKAFKHFFQRHSSQWFKWPSHEDWESIEQEGIVSVPNYAQLEKTKGISIKVRDTFPSAEQDKYSWHHGARSKQPSSLVCYLLDDREDFPQEWSHAFKNKVEAFISSYCPDGLLPGQTLLMKNWDNDILLCGCLKWGIGVHKVFAEVIKFCIGQGSYYTAVYICLPYYPKEHLLVTLFHCLDVLVHNMRQNFCAYFYSMDVATRKAFQEELLKRQPKPPGYLHKVIDYFWNGWFKKDSKEKAGPGPKSKLVRSNQQQYRLCFIAKTEDSIRQACKKLHSDLEHKMDKNHITLQLNHKKSHLHSTLEELVKHASKVSAQLRLQVADNKPASKRKKNKGGRGKSSGGNPQHDRLELQITGLSSYYVDSFIDDIKSLAGQDIFYPDLHDQLGKQRNLKQGTSKQTEDNINPETRMSLHTRPQDGHEQKKAQIQESGEGLQQSKAQAQKQSLQGGEAHRNNREHPKRNRLQGGVETDLQKATQQQQIDAQRVRDVSSYSGSPSEAHSGRHNFGETETQQGRRPAPGIAKIASSLLESYNEEHDKPEVAHGRSPHMSVDVGASQEEKCHDLSHVSSQRSSSRSDISEGTYHDTSNLSLSDAKASNGKQWDAKDSSSSQSDQSMMSASSFEMVQQDDGRGDSAGSHKLTETGAHGGYSSNLYPKLETIDDASEAKETVAKPNKAARPAISNFVWLVKLSSKGKSSSFQELDPEMSAEIEKRYANQIPGVEYVYGEIVDLAHMTLKRENAGRPLIRREVVDGTRLAKIPTGIPDCWDPDGNGSFESLKESSSMYKMLKDTLDKDLSQHDVDIDITRIEEIRNAELLCRYKWKQLQLQLSHPKERQLWHRVGSNSRRQIAQYGLHFNFMASPSDERNEAGPSVCWFYENAAECFSEDDYEQERDVHLIRANVLAQTEEPRCFIESDTQAYPTYIITMRAMYK